MSSSRATGSRPLVGSSKTSSRAWWDSAMAIISFTAMPRDRSLTLARDVQAELAEQVVVPRAVPAVVEGPNRPLDLAQPPVAHEVGVVEHHPDVLPQGDRGRDPVAEHLDLAPLDPLHPQQASDGRGLAGAVGSDEAHDIALSEARS